MPTRRAVLIAGAIAGSAAWLRTPVDVVAAPSQPKTRVSFDVPTGACDCHIHIYGDPHRFPFTPSRSYTPEQASVDQSRALHRALGTDRVVLVQPSVYGTDNACLIDALGRLKRNARGIAVVADDIADSALDTMHRQGVRGIRINLEAPGQMVPEVARRRIAAAIDRVKGRPWQVQIYTRPSVIEAIGDLVAAAPVPIVFDHFGGARADLGLHQPGFDAFVNLVRGGHAYVKLSAPYLSSTQGPEYPDLEPFAKALIAANAARMLWATNWPHPDSSGSPRRPIAQIARLRQVDDAIVFNTFARWVPDPSTRNRILVDNPGMLYQF
jgi:predicted TIM-barrel fold metal-dependent hydrolase